jgi:hypothetical protein
MTEHTSSRDFFADYLRAQAEEARQQLAANADLINSFIGSAKASGVALKPSNFSYVPTIGIIAAAPDLATHLLGDIPVDRDGLYSFDSLCRRFAVSDHQAGYLIAQQFMLMAHPHFRRGYHDGNNFSPRFIELLWGHTDANLARYVALDSNRVRVNVDQSAYFERDTWFGAPFDQEISSIPTGLVKLRPPLSIAQAHTSLFFADAYALDIKWSQQGHIKTFQGLELKTNRVTVRLGDQDYYPARYMHAEYDLQLGAFRHFDGAIQYYTEPEYEARRDSDLNHNAKTLDLVKARSRKLFKFNGSLSVIQWVNLCCHYLSGNPLVYEYFTGQYPTHIAEVLPKLEALAAQSTDA